MVSAMYDTRLFALMLQIISI